MVDRIMRYMGEEVHSHDGYTRETSHKNMPAEARPPARISSHHKTRIWQL